MVKRPICQRDLESKFRRSICEKVHCDSITQKDRRLFSQKIRRPISQKSEGPSLKWPINQKVRRPCNQRAHWSETKDPVVRKSEGPLARRQISQRDL